MSRHSKAKGGNAIKWWQRGLVDGADCFKKRRERYYDEYLANAEEFLAPGPLVGPFLCLYRLAFRAGYDEAKRKRESDNIFVPRPRKRC